jgi:hypothetical protein
MTWRTPSFTTVDEVFATLDTMVLPAAMWIDGQRSEASAGATTELVSPGYGRPFAHCMAAQLDAGNVWGNCYEEGDHSVPFGGRKLSGHGADKGTYGLEKFTNLKTTWMTVG